MANKNVMQELAEDLSYEEIRKRGALQRVSVPLPDWGMTGEVRQLTAAELMQVNDDTGDDNIQRALHLLARSLVRPKLTLEQVKAIYEEDNPDPILSLMNASRKLNVVSKEEQEKVEGSFPHEDSRQNGHKRGAGVRVQAG